jgi:hypothetical protein
MHQDHQQWLSDNNMWRCDLAAWQQELRDGLAAIKEVMAALESHEAALQSHGAAVRLRELDMRTHEHALAEYERGQSGAELITLMHSHQKEADKHLQQAAAHERMKKHQHQVMARIHALKKGLAEAG